MPSDPGAYALLRREHPIVMHFVQTLGMTGKKFLTREAAADYLGITTKTLANWAWRERGPRFYRASGKPLYELSDLNAWVRSNGRNASYKRDEPSGP